MSAAPTPEERAAVDAVLGRPESAWSGGERAELDGHVARGGREQRDRRHLLLPALHALQARVGWISEGGLNYLCAGYQAFFRHIDAPMRAMSALLRAGRAPAEIMWASASRASASASAASAIGAPSPRGAALPG